MTTNVAARQSEWAIRAAGIRDWKTLAEGLTYEQALAKEQAEAERLGCESGPGGPRLDGPVWSVYYFKYDYDRMRR